MKLENSKFGKSLSKDQQKAIKGGGSICTIGQVAACKCVDPAWEMCVFADGHNTAIGLCSSTNACGPHGGLVSARCVGPGICPEY